MNRFNNAQNISNLLTSETQADFTKAHTTNDIGNDGEENRLHYIYKLRYLRL